MLSDDLVEGVISLEEEMASRSSKSSNTSSSDSCSEETGLNLAKLNGKVVSGDLLQLARDNIILAASKKASRSVADDLNKAHMILQNRFRINLRNRVLPQLTETINPSAASMPNIPAVTIDFGKFVYELEHMLGPNDQIPVQKAHDEARAIQSFMRNVDRVLQAQGFKAEVISVVKNRLLEVQELFIDYLSNTDARTRIEKLISLQT